MAKKYSYDVVKNNEYRRVKAHKVVTTDGDCLVFMNWIDSKLQPVVMFSSSEWEYCIMDGEVINGN
jgi:hypothetical protein